MSFLSRSWSYPDWSATEWNRIRRGIALIWLGWVLWIVWSYHSQPVPTGLSRVVNLSFLTAPGINVLITLLSLAAAIQYWRGRQLLLASSVMALLGILTFTLHDSQGAFQRNEVLNLVLLGQVIFGIQAWLKARKGEAFSPK